jgi:dimethylargininase
MLTALLRPVPETFDQAIVRGGTPPDTTLARTQHDSYRRALETAGYRIETLPSDDAHPDSVFVEDTAVIIGDVAVATRPGAPSRRGEVGPVMAFLRDLFAVESIETPGTLDGGDVMQLNGKVYVGLSDRTNRAGIGQLQDIITRQGRELVVVAVSGVLHLKSGVVPVDDQTVVVTPGAVDEARLDGLRIVFEDDHERGRFSALPLASGDVLVAEAAPKTAASLGDLGFQVLPIDISEIMTADGGLTCMSILFDA